MFDALRRACSAMNPAGSATRPGFAFGRLALSGAATLAAAFGSAGIADASNFTPGNLVAVRIGDGSAALTSAATAVFLDEYTPAGVLVQTIPLPTSTSGANFRLTNSGSATSEGLLNLSANGQYFVHAGYDAALGTASVVSTTSATNPRVVARVDLAGNIDTSTALSDAYSGNNIRSATSDDGLQFWTAGTATTVGGVRYAANLGATTSIQLSTTITNTRVVGIFNGQLYLSSSTGAFQGVSTVGTGLPTTAGQTIVLLPGFPTTSGPSAYDYFFADATTLYVADDRATLGAGGIQKWTLSGGTWALQYNLNPGTTVGCRGLSGVVAGGVTTLYATTTSGNAIVSVIDLGAGSPFTTVATSATNTVLRGLRFLPAAGCTVSAIDAAGQPDDTTACIGGSASFTVTATGTGPFLYQWLLNGLPLLDGFNISGATTATLTINPVSAADFGNYSVIVTNACGPVTSNVATLSLDTVDTDGDGTIDCDDGCPLDPNKIVPGPCGCGVADTDTDGDGTADCIDGCPTDPLKIAPGICGCGTADTDTDGDGTPDCNDGCPADPLKVAPGVCGCGVADTDTDGDSTPDCNDGCPLDPFKIAPGVCGCGVADTDTDGDGTADCNDGCPLDPLKVAPGACGCGVADTDTDGDGTLDCNDGCPNDPFKVAPGACGCGVADTDTDGDGTADCIDGCPSDPFKVTPGACGCGIADTDTDGDGTADCIDGCPNDPFKVAPGACGCGVADTDIDGDGTADCIDGCPNDPLKVAPGICGCGVADTDTDGDSTPDCNDGCPADPLKTAPGVCGCGVADTDTDGDSTPDCVDGCPNDALKVTPGACGCGVADTDSDSDGTADCNDGCPTDPLKIAPDQCGCGVAETDADGDSVADCIDNCDAVSNLFQDDGDSDGVGDACDNCILLPNPGQGDCDGNTIGDACEIAGGALDCNTNGIPDACDIANGASVDVNGNGVPDECEGGNITLFCFGYSGCPCGNNSPPDSEKGCVNSTGIGGHLTGSGQTSLTNDTLDLFADALPVPAGGASAALFFQGDLATNVPFQDGIRCVAGSQIRLGTKLHTTGFTNYPQSGDLPVSVRGMVTTPGVRYYQVWYRNVLGPCGTGSNLTNGVQVNWIP